MDCGESALFSRNPAHLRTNVWDTRPSKDPHPIYHGVDEESRRTCSDAKERVVNKAMPVIKYQEFIPHPVLQNYVKRYWILEKEYTAEDGVEEVIPDACVELILNFGVAYAQVDGSTRRFGYPDFFRASADELIDRQYADRPQLRPIFDAVISAAARLGEVIIQARKTYVSLVSPRRIFVCLRLAGTLA